LVGATVGDLAGVDEDAVAQVVAKPWPHPGLG
jgi:hypothetical protein